MTSNPPTCQEKESSIAGLKACIAVPSQCPHNAQVSGPESPKGQRSQAYCTKPVTQENPRPSGSLPSRCYQRPCATLREKSVGFCADSDTLVRRRVRSMGCYYYSKIHHYIFSISLLLFLMWPSLILDAKRRLLVPLTYNRGV